MAKVSISGSIIEQCDCSVMPFLDTSTYLDSSDNAILEITPPNWTTFARVAYHMNAITLIRPSDIKHASFTDGVYHFKQSVCPNDKTAVEWCYLNVCCAKERLKKLACQYLDTDEKLSDILDIKFGLQIAQEMMNDDSCDKSKVIDLYNTLCKQIDSLENANECDNC